MLRNQRLGGRRAKSKWKQLLFHSKSINMLNFEEPVEIFPPMPINVGNHWDKLKVTIILYNLKFLTTLMHYQPFQQFIYDDNSVVPLLILEVIEEYLVVSQRF